MLSITFPPIFISAKLGKSLNMQLISYFLNIWFSIETYFKEVHLKKDSLPILITESGIVILTKLLHP